MGTIIGAFFALACAESSPAELVRQLGDESYRAREAATVELLRLGSVAKAAVSEGLGGDDPEVRDRCERILPQILAADLNERIQKFLDDPALAATLDLPGYDRYVELCGDGPAARELYVELVREHGRLIQAVETDRRQAPTKFREFASRFADQRRFVPNGGVVTPNNASRVDVAAVLFAGSYADARSADLPYLQVSAILRLPAFTQAVRDEGDPVRKLLAAWAARQTHQTILIRIFTIATTSDIKELLPFAVRHLADKQSLPRSRAFAMLAVGKHGSKEHVAAVEQLLDDKAALTAVNVNGKRGTVEVRDVALAVCVQLSGETLEGYGFDLLNTYPVRVTSFYQLGFSDDEKREAALERWRERDK